MEQGIQEREYTKSGEWPTSKELHQGMINRTVLFREIYIIHTKDMESKYSMKFTRAPCLKSDFVTWMGFV